MRSIIKDNCAIRTYLFMAVGKKSTKEQLLPELVNIFFADLQWLMDKEMTISEAFYFAAMIHLVWVKIHPFADGNGRSARLLEKWFLAQKLGPKAWIIDSEKMYQKRIRSYYIHLDIGPSYAQTNFDLCMPFLTILPISLAQNREHF
ncbi:MAG: Fic family protein [Chitinophagia bacterium]|nr:Fic family protein [Chitinophagia bacterium]